jgi:hypothetical protein
MISHHPYVATNTVGDLSAVNKILEVNHLMVQFNAVEILSDLGQGRERAA